MHSIQDDKQEDYGSQIEVWPDIGGLKDLLSVRVVET